MESINRNGTEAAVHAVLLDVCTSQTYNCGQSLPFAQSCVEVGSLVGKEPLYVPMASSADLCAAICASVGAEVRYRCKVEAVTGEPSLLAVRSDPFEIDRCARRWRFRSRMESRKTHPSACIVRAFLLYSACANPAKNNYGGR